MFERETKREKNLETRAKELRIKERKEAEQKGKTTTGGAVSGSTGCTVRCAAQNARSNSRSSGGLPSADDQ